MAATFDTLAEIDRRLAAAGQYPLPAYWITQAKRLYSHPTASVLVGQCGRGGVKSGFGTRVGENEVLCGDFVVPEGEIHYWVDVSENKAEAQQRLRQYETHLTILGIPYERRGDEIIIPHLRRGFLVRAFELGRVSGFRAIGGRADELAKAAPDATEGAEVVSSMVAMTITHRAHRPKLLLLSSPVGRLDYHCQRFDLGDTAAQLVCNAPTWVANPSISESDTHAAEPDDRIWRREYLAQPQDGVLAAFPYDIVMRAFEPRTLEFQSASKFVLLDPSSGGASTADWFTWAIASWCVDTLPDHERYVLDQLGQPIMAPTGELLETGYAQRWAPKGPPYLKFHEVDGIQGGFFGTVSGEQIVDKIALLARKHRAKAVHMDQRESLFLSSALSRRGLSVHVHPWTAANKPDAVALVRRWLADNILWLPAHERLKRELLAFEEKISPSGQLTFGARRGGHDDHVATLITCALAELDGGLPRSPLGPHRSYARLQAGDWRLAR